MQPAPRTFTDWDGQEQAYRELDRAFVAFDGAQDRDQYSPIPFGVAENAKVEVVREAFAVVQGRSRQLRRGLERDQQQRYVLELEHLARVASEFADELTELHGSLLTIPAARALGEHAWTFAGKLRATLAEHDTLEALPRPTPLGDEADIDPQAGENDAPTEADLSNTELHRLVGSVSEEVRTALGGVEDSTMESLAAQVRSDREQAQTDLADTLSAVLPVEAPVREFITGMIIDAGAVSEATYAALAGLQTSAGSLAKGARRLVQAGVACAQLWERGAGEGPWAEALSGVGLPGRLESLRDDDNDRALVPRPFIDAEQLARIRMLHERGPDPLEPDDLANALERSSELLGLVRSFSDRTINPGRKSGSSGWRDPGEPLPGAYHSRSTIYGPLQVKVGSPEVHREQSWTWPQLRKWISPGLTPALEQVLLRSHRLLNQYRSHQTGFALTEQHETHAAVVAELTLLAAGAQQEIVSRAAAAARADRSRMLDPTLHKHPNIDLDAAAHGPVLGVTENERALLQRLESFASALPAAGAGGGYPPYFTPLEQVEPGMVLQSGPNDEHPDAVWVVTDGEFADLGEFIEIPVRAHESRPDLPETFRLPVRAQRIDGSSMEPKVYVRPLPHQLEPGLVTPLAEVSGLASAEADLREPAQVVEAIRTACAQAGVAEQEVADRVVSIVRHTADSRAFRRSPEHYRARVAQRIMRNLIVAVGSVASARDLAEQIMARVPTDSAVLKQLAIGVRQATARGEDVASQTMVAVENRLPENMPVQLPADAPATDNTTDERAGAAADLASELVAAEPDSAVPSPPISLRELRELSERFALELRITRVNERRWVSLGEPGAAPVSVLSAEVGTEGDGVWCAGRMVSAEQVQQQLASYRHRFPTGVFGPVPEVEDWARRIAELAPATMPGSNVRRDVAPLVNRAVTLARNSRPDTQEIQNLLDEAEDFAGKPELAPERAAVAMHASAQLRARKNAGETVTIDALITEIESLGCGNVSARERAVFSDGWVSPEHDAAEEISEKSSRGPQYWVGVARHWNEQGKIALAQDAVDAAEILAPQYRKELDTLRNGLGKPGFARDEPAWNLPDSTMSEGTAIGSVGVFVADAPHHAQAGDPGASAIAGSAGEDVESGSTRSPEQRSGWQGMTRQLAPRPMSVVPAVVRTTVEDAVTALRELTPTESWGEVDARTWRSRLDALITAITEKRVDNPVLSPSGALLAYKGYREGRNRESLEWFVIHVASGVPVKHLANPESPDDLRRHAIGSTRYPHDVSKPMILRYLEGLERLTPGIDWSQDLASVLVSLATWTDTQGGTNADGRQPGFSELHAAAVMHAMTPNPFGSILSTEVTEAIGHVTPSSIAGRPTTELRHRFDTELARLPKITTVGGRPVAADEASAKVVALARLHAFDGDPATAVDLLRWRASRATLPSPHGPIAERLHLLADGVAELRSPGQTEIDRLRQLNVGDQLVEITAEGQTHQVWTAAEAPKPASPDAAEASDVGDFDVSVHVKSAPEAQATLRVRLSGARQQQPSIQLDVPGQGPRSLPLQSQGSWAVVAADEVVPGSYEGVLALASRAADAFDQQAMPSEPPTRDDSTQPTSTPARSSTDVSTSARGEVQDGETDALARFESANEARESEQTTDNAQLGLQERQQGVEDHNGQTFTRVAVQGSAPSGPKSSEASDPLADQPSPVLGGSRIRSGNAEEQPSLFDMELGTHRSASRASDTAWSQPSTPASEVAGSVESAPVPDDQVDEDVARRLIAECWQRSGDAALTNSERSAAEAVLRLADPRSNPRRPYRPEPDRIAVSDDGRVGAVDGSGHGRLPSVFSTDSGAMLISASELERALPIDFSLLDRQRKQLVDHIASLRDEAGAVLQLVPGGELTRRILHEAVPRLAEDVGQPVVARMIREGTTRATQRDLALVLWDIGTRAVLPLINGEDYEPNEHSAGRPGTPAYTYLEDSHRGLAIAIKSSTDLTVDGPDQWVRWGEWRQTQLRRWLAAYAEHPATAVLADARRVTVSYTRDGRHVGWDRSTATELRYEVEEIQRLALREVCRAIAADPQMPSDTPRASPDFSATVTNETYDELRKLSQRLDDLYARFDHAARQEAGLPPRDLEQRRPLFHDGQSQLLDPTTERRHRADVVALSHTECERRHARLLELAQQQGVEEREAFGALSSRIIDLEERLLSHWRETHPGEPVVDVAEAIEHGILPVVELHPGQESEPLPRADADAEELLGWARQHLGLPADDDDIVDGMLVALHALGIDVYQHRHTVVDSSPDAITVPFIRTAETPYVVAGRLREAVAEHRATLIDHTASRIEASADRELAERAQTTAARNANAPGAAQRTMIEVLPLASPAALRDHAQRVDQLAGLARHNERDMWLRTSTGEPIRRRPLHASSLEAPVPLREYLTAGQFVEDVKDIERLSWRGMPIQLLQDPQDHQSYAIHIQAPGDAQGVLIRAESHWIHSPGHATELARALVRWVDDLPAEASWAREQAETMAREAGSTTGSQATINSTVLPTENNFSDTSSGSRRPTDHKGADPKKHNATRRGNVTDEQRLVAESGTHQPALFDTESDEVVGSLAGSGDTSVRAEPRVRLRYSRERGVELLNSAHLTLPSDLSRPGKYGEYNSGTSNAVRAPKDAGEWEWISPDGDTAGRWRMAGTVGVAADHKTVMRLIVAWHGLKFGEVPAEPPEIRIGDFVDTHSKLTYLRLVEEPPAPTGSAGRSVAKLTDSDIVAALLELNRHDPATFGALWESVSDTTKDERLKRMRAGKRAFEQPQHFPEPGALVAYEVFGRGLRITVTADGGDEVRTGKPSWRQLQTLLRDGLLQMHGRHLTAGKPAASSQTPRSALRSEPENGMPAPAPTATGPTPTDRLTPVLSGDSAPQSASNSAHRVEQRSEGLLPVPENADGGVVTDDEIAALLSALGPTALAELLGEGNHPPSVAEDPEKFLLPPDYPALAWLPKQAPVPHTMVPTKDGMHFTVPAPMTTAETSGGRLTMDKSVSWAQLRAWLATGPADTTLHQALRTGGMLIERVERHLASGGFGVLGEHDVADAECGTIRQHRDHIADTLLHEAWRDHTAATAVAHASLTPSLTADVLARWEMLLDVMPEATHWRVPVTQISTGAFVDDGYGLLQLTELPHQDGTHVVLTGHLIPSAPNDQPVTFHVPAKTDTPELRTLLIPGSLRTLDDEADTDNAVATKDEATATTEAMATDVPTHERTPENGQRDAGANTDAAESPTTADRLETASDAQNNPRSRSGATTSNTAPPPAPDAAAQIDTPTLRAAAQQHHLAVRRINVGGEALYVVHEPQVPHAAVLIMHPHTNLVHTEHAQLSTVAEVNSWLNAYRGNLPYQAAQAAAERWKNPGWTARLAAAARWLGHHTPAADAPAEVQQCLREITSALTTTQATVGDVDSTLTRAEQHLPAAHTAPEPWKTLTQPTTTQAAMTSPPRAPKAGEEPTTSTTTASPSARTPSASSSEDRQTLLAEINQAAAEWFTANLNNNAEASKYLAKRLGETGVTAARDLGFVIGYAPRRGLYTHLSKTYKTDDLIEAGVIRRGDGRGRDEFYDTFRHRIVFALHDLDGRICGFTGRSLDPQAGTPDSKIPKYYNTADTGLFKKGQLLFGAYEQRTRANRSHTVMSEGPMDVLAIALAAASTNNSVISVAACGTAIKDEQLMMLDEFTGQGRQLIFALDGDNAGRKGGLDATRRALSLTNRKVMVTMLPADYDPAALYAQLGADSLDRYADRTRTRPALEALINQILDQRRAHIRTDTEGNELERTYSDSTNAAARSDIAALLADYDTATVEHYTRYAAMRAGWDPRIAEETLPSLVAEAAQANHAPAPTKPPTATEKADATAQPPESVIDIPLPEEPPPADEAVDLTSQRQLSVSSAELISTMLSHNPDATLAVEFRARWRAATFPLAAEASVDSAGDLFIELLQLRACALFSRLDVPPGTALTAEQSQRLRELVSRDLQNQDKPNVTYWLQEILHNRTTQLPDMMRQAARTMTEQGWALLLRQAGADVDVLMSADRLEWQPTLPTRDLRGRLAELIAVVNPPTPASRATSAPSAAQPQTRQDPSTRKPSPRKSIERARIRIVHTRDAGSEIHGLTRNDRFDDLRRLARSQHGRFLGHWRHDTDGVYRLPGTIGHAGTPEAVRLLSTVATTLTEAGLPVSVELAKSEFTPAGRIEIQRASLTTPTPPGPLARPLTKTEFNTWPTVRKLKLASPDPNTRLHVAPLGNRWVMHARTVQRGQTIDLLLSLRDQERLDEETTRLLQQPQLVATIAQAAVNEGIAQAWVNGKPLATQTTSTHDHSATWRSAPRQAFHNAPAGHHRSPTDYLGNVFGNPHQSTSAYHQPSSSPHPSSQPNPPQLRPAQHRAGGSGAPSSRHR